VRADGPQKPPRREALPLTMPHHPNSIPFEGRWSERSGDSRVAYVETCRALRADFPDERQALRNTFAAFNRERDAQRAQRERFAAYRAATRNA